MLESVWRCVDLCDDWVIMSLFALGMDCAVVGVRIGGELCDGGGG